MAIKRFRLSGGPGILFVSMAVVGMTGCGSDETTSAHVPSMVSATRAEDGPSMEQGSNAAPVVEGVELRPANPVPGRTVRAVASASDPDGDATRIRYVWRTTKGRVLGEGRSFETQGLEEGEVLEVVVTATDGEADSAPFVQQFRLASPSIEIARVEIDSSEGTKPGSILEAVVESTDGEADDSEVLLEWEVDGKVVGSEKELDTTPFSPGDSVFLNARLELEDRSTRSVRSAPVTLSRGEAPMIVSEPRTGIEGGVFRYQIRATSEERGAQFSYELLEGPEGMTVDAATGQVAWRPDKTQLGVFKIEVSATDQWGSGNAQSFRIQVDAPDSVPASPR